MNLLKAASNGPIRITVGPVASPQMAVTSWRNRKERRAQEARWRRKAR